MQNVKIAMVGAGGVGGPLGASLHRSGEQLWFLARGAHLEAIRARGLRITSAAHGYQVRDVNATDDPAEIGPVDVVLLAVKLWDLDTAVKSLAPLLAPETVVVTLQNGVDAPGQVASLLGDSHVAAGICFVNAGIIAPGVIVQRSPMQKIVAGMLNGTRSATLERFGDACRAAHIEFEIARAPIDALWEKFIQLVPSSAMTSLLRQPIGAVRADKDTWGLFVQILNETVEVGRASGANIPPEVVERRLRYVQEMPFEAIASMAKDLIRGQRLELPWLSGRVCALGRHYGVPTPVNDFIVAALKPFVDGSASRRVYSETYAAAEAAATGDPR